VLTTDGVHESCGRRRSPRRWPRIAHDLDAGAAAIASAAAAAGSEDNLTVQVLRIDRLPDAAASELSRQAADLPLPPELAAAHGVRGLRIVRAAARRQPQPRLAGGGRADAGADRR
jgi:hypothetical protein